MTQSLIFLMLLLSPCLAEIKELITASGLNKFKKQDEPVAILYYKNSGLQQLKSRVLNIMKSVDEQMETDGNAFVQLAVANCLTPDIAEGKFDECSKKRTFVAYKDKGKMNQEFYLQELFNVEAFEAQLFNFIYNDKVGLVQDKSDLDFELTACKGRIDILLLYTQGIGSPDHNRFLKYARNDLDKYRYLVSTDHQFVSEAFRTNVSDFGLFYLPCKSMSANHKSLSHRQFQSKRFPKQSVVNAFIESAELPIFEEIKEDGTTSLPHGFHLVYIIADNDDDITRLSKMFELAMATIQTDDALLRGVIVDTRKFERLDMFGLITKNMLPTVVVQLDDGRKESEVVFEYFSPDQDLTEKNFLSFIDALLNHFEKHVQKIADIYFVASLESSAWQLDEKKDSIVGGCLDTDDDLKEECKEFQFTFRHFVRTLQLHDLWDIEFVYLDHNNDPSDAAKDFPKLTFHSSKQKPVLFSGELTYRDVLKWFNGIYGSNVSAIPASSNDWVPLSLGSERTDVNRESVEDDLGNLQDDEIRADALKNDVVVYRDNVTIVTDKTFNRTLDDNELLIVLFYVDFDSRSKLFEPVFAKVHDALAKEEKKQAMKAKLVKVSCSSEFTTCGEMRITTYPLIKIFRNGKTASIYHGLLNEKSVTDAILLEMDWIIRKPLEMDPIIRRPIYQYESPFALSTLEQVDAFEKGTETIPYSQVAFIAWFPKEDGDLVVYKKVAQEYYGKLLFAYVIDDDVSKLPSGYKHPFIASYNRKDELKKRNIMSDGVFNEENLHKFVQKSLIPNLGELNMGNFPLYKSQGLPIVTLFISSQRRLQSDQWRDLVEAAQAKEDLGILFVWMNMDYGVTQRIRRSYLGSKNLKQSNEIIIVNHSNGEVYWYDQSKNQTTIIQWIKDCASGKINKISSLPKTQWKPLREGFDFLYFIDNAIGGVGGKDVTEVNPRLRGGRAHPHADDAQKQEGGQANSVNVRRVPDEHDEGAYMDSISEEIPYSSEQNTGEEDEEDLENALEASSEYKHDEF